MRSTTTPESMPKPTRYTPTTIPSVRFRSFIDSSSLLDRDDRGSGRRPWLTHARHERGDALARGGIAAPVGQRHRQGERLPRDLVIAEPGEGLAGARHALGVAALARLQQGGEEQPAGLGDRHGPSLTGLADPQRRSAGG